MDGSDFTWSVRVASTDKDIARSYVRQHSFEAGAPIHFDSEYDRVTALEYVLGAIGADLVNGFKAVCRTRRLPVDDVEAVVTGRLENPLTYLGVVGEQGRPNIETVDVKLYVSAGAEEDDLAAAWDETRTRSPLAQTFGNVLRFDVKIDSTGERSSVPNRV